MSYSYRVKQTNDIPDDNGEPYELTILRQARIIELQEKEIARLQAVIHRLEQAPVAAIPQCREGIGWSKGDW